jgi:F-type H+-transporting ATPase subunit b
MMSKKIGGKIARAVFFVIFMAGCASVISMNAQDHPQEPAPNEPPPKQQKKPAGRHALGPGGQLAHESNEAAGEGQDEMAEFKESASVSWIAHKLHISLQNAYWLSIVLNFIVIGAAIFWASRKSLPGIFRDRSAAIQKAMQEAQKASEEAQRRLAEIESRLAKLDVEIGTMRDAAEKEGAAEAERIQLAAEEDARKIIAAAEQEIAAAAKAARRQLKVFAADLAVGLARKQIHVDANTDQALVQNFAGELGAWDDSGKGRN